MKTKIQSLLSALLILIGAANSQCIMSNDYGDVIAPTTAGVVTISSCSYYGEYSTINSVQAATTYICTVDGPGYVTITQGSSTGPIIAFGVSPLTWSSTVAGTYYAHWAQNASCGTSNICQLTTIDYVGPSAPCTNPVTAGAAQANLALACLGQNFNLSLNGASLGSGLTYQWQSSATSGGPWTNIAGATNGSYSTTQTVNTYYRCQVACSGGTPSFSSEVYVAMNAFTNCYCSSVAMVPLVDEEIYSVTVNGASTDPLYAGANGCTTVAPGPGSVLGGYSNFTTTGPLTTLTIGQTVAFSIFQDECNGGPYYENGIGVWIDFDQNGVFDNPTELVYMDQAVVMGPRTINGSFLVPTTALTGNTVMRVICAEGAAATGWTILTPCLTYGYGETEDYVINILPAPDCANPTNITAASGVDSIMTTWSWSQSIEPITGYNYQLVEAGMPFSTGTTYTIDANSNDTLVDPSFIAGQSFEVYLQAVCGQDTSYFIGPVPVVLPMTNDQMCNAAEIPVDGHAYIFNNTGASIDQTEVAVVPPATGAQTTTGWANQNLNLTTWFTFTAPPSGNVRINSTAMNYNGQIAVYAATDCSILSSIAMEAANDDDLDGTNAAPNFTICGLNPGDTYFILNDAFNNTAGNYAIAISEIDLNAGVEGELVEVCYGDTVNLFNGIANYQLGGQWSQTIPTLGLQGSNFVTTGLATVLFEFTYSLLDGCASDDVNAYVDVYPASSAGENGTFIVCKNEPFNLLAGLGGTVDMGGYWLDPSNNPLGSNIDTASNIPGNFNYDYIVTNGVCPADTSTVLVVVDGSCDFTAGMETLVGNFMVYPNPSSDVLNIENGLGLTIDKIELLDMSGRVVYTAQKGSFNNQLAEIAIGQLTSGVYTLKLSSGMQIFTNRVVKQ